MASAMALKSFYVASVLLCLCKSSFEQAIFNPLDYEAEGDGKTDDSQALVDAWDSACEHHAPAIFLIPAHTTFLSGPASFEGPCRVTPRVHIVGTLKAVESISAFHYPAWIEFKHLDDLHITGGGTLDGQGARSWPHACSSCKKLPMSLRLLKVSTMTLANLTFLNSKGFHISVQQSSFINITHLNITAPGDSPNTDGIHISGTTDIKIADLHIGTGDDCISIGQGATNVNIANVRCGPGHGISIGSLGKYQNEANVFGVHVRNCSLSETTNGVRIKTWPGSPPSQASNFTFQDIVMDNVANPIFIDQQYCPDSKCTGAPSQVKIRNVQFKRIRGTSNGPVAVKLLCSPSVPCENVFLEEISLTMANNAKSSTTLSSCSNVKGSAAGTQKPDPCVKKVPARGSENAREAVKDSGKAPPVPHRQTKPYARSQGRKINKHRGGRNSKP
ncbi:exopolygalacturonase-like [Zingiber officinale]|uniref:exopolygalacturonase-like n=1 Tax=Zingiber officinale TaxID=94328 RepID=UPI001C4BF4D0|nr:exopolygalacturonase-like [Zingiber officinale]XP_042422991.1 exopolygalacturonase-like [Zingiber officinale]